MKNPLPRWRQFPIWAIPLFLGLAMTLAPGCATRREVAEIVARSNAAMLTSQLGAGIDLLTNATRGATGPAGTGGVDPSAQIDAFIEAHSDQPATVAALRVRQGVLLLSQRRFNLARAAFGAALVEHLHTDRDLALKRLSIPLVWWGENSLLNPFPESMVPRAQEAMKAFDAEVTRLGRPPGAAESMQTRDLLAEIRAWIALTVTRRASDFPTMKTRLEEALDTYGAILTPADLEALQQPERVLAESSITQEGRRRLRSKAVLAAGAERFQELEREGIHPTLHSPELQRLVAHPLHP